MEGHPKEVIPIPLSFLCLLSFYLRGFVADAGAHLLVAKAEAGTQTEERRGTAHCEIAAFYPTAVKSQIRPPSCETVSHTGI